MTDEHRDIGDIKTVVHALDVRLTRVEEHQAAQDRMMAAEHQRLHEKIDAQSGFIQQIHNLLRDHTEQEDADRKALIGRMSILIGTAVLGAAGYFGSLVIEHMNK